MSFTSFVSKLPFCAWGKKFLERRSQTKSCRAGPPCPHAQRRRSGDARCAGVGVAESTILTIASPPPPPPPTLGVDYVDRRHLQRWRRHRSAHHLYRLRRHQWHAHHRRVLSQINITDSVRGRLGHLQHQHFALCRVLQHRSRRRRCGGAITFNGTSQFQKALTAITQGANTGSITVLPCRRRQRQRQPHSGKRTEPERGPERRPGPDGRAPRTRSCAGDGHGDLRRCDHRPGRHDHGHGRRGHHADAAVADDHGDDVLQLDSAAPLR